MIEFYIRVIFVSIDAGPNSSEDGMVLDFADRAALAGVIQFTNVRPNLTQAELVEHVESCAELAVHAAMVGPYWVPLAKEILAGTGVRVATTLNFPQGNDSAVMKAAVVEHLAEAGADEFDFPPNPGLLLSGLDEEYRNEIQAVVDAGHRHGLVVKAMLEFGFLPTEDLRVKAVVLACSTGIDWIKQSSGWGDGGIAATVEDVALMKRHLTGPARIKVSGKVNSREKVIALFEAGARLVGTSSAREILAGTTGDAHAY